MRRFRAALATILSLGAVAPGVHAQAPDNPPRIGYLEAYATPAGWADAFRRGLQDLGYVEGRTIIIERRSAAGQAARLPGLAAELVRLKPQIIVASTVPGALAAKNATATIPVVMTNTSDPVRLGLVKSLARPGGNVTGLSTLSAGLAVKRLELLAEIRPGFTKVGVVGNRVRRGGKLAYGKLQAAAAALHLRLELFEVRRPEEFDAAFKAAAARVGGVVVMNNPEIRSHRDIVVAAAARHRVPAIYFDAEIVRAGGLMAYGTDIPDLHRRAAIYVDKILKGAKPADLPVERPIKFTLGVNLKTAKALGIAFPRSVLLRADKVIE